MDNKEKNIFGWLDLIISKSTLPFSFCEDQIFLKYTNLKKIDKDTLLKYAHLTVELVETKILNLLP